MNYDRFISVLCAQQWAKCKGELRTLIELQGQKESQYDENNMPVKNREWQRLEFAVIMFIRRIEDDGLNE